MRLRWYFLRGRGLSGVREKSKSLIFKINREVEVVEMKGLGF